MTERQFQSQVISAAKQLGWTHIYHTHDSRRSAPGFPDLVLVKTGRIVFAELKAEKGRVSEAQKSWIAALRLAGCTAFVWRPSDWDEICAILSK